MRQAAPEQRICHPSQPTSWQRQDRRKCTLNVEAGSITQRKATWPWVLRLNRLEQVKDVFRARRRPKSQETMIRIGKRTGRLTGST